MAGHYPKIGKKGPATSIDLKLRGPATKSPKALNESLKKSELRCVKYSPIVRPSNYCPSQESHDCEASLWDTTFNSMGGLKAIGMDDVKTFTILNKQPYHCAVTARIFDASYGALARVGHIPKDTRRSYKPPKKEFILPTMGMSSLPKRNNVPTDPNAVPIHLFTGQKPKMVAYMPPSAVRIRWGNHVTDSREVLCEWLSKKFGSVAFVIPEGGRQCIVVFKDIRCSYSLVNSGIPPATLNATWYDSRFNNFGHYSIHKRYKLSTDENWSKDHLKERGGYLKAILSSITSNP